MTHNQSHTKAEDYKKIIASLIDASPFSINADSRVENRPPTMASSEFLTNKEQGDWAEHIVFAAINDNSDEFVAVRYGRSESLSAGDKGFSEFYAGCQEELNTIGKRPDLLIFRRQDISPNADLSDDNFVCKAIAAIEVRSSSFLADKYAAFMNDRYRHAEENCLQIKKQILVEPLRGALQAKSPAILTLIESATPETFRDLDFRRPSWTTTPTLEKLTDLLRQLKGQIETLHRRDYLSITPKVEDLALVNRWIQKFGVPHYYLQVFFDKAYIISFKEILEISSDPEKEEVVFSVERDVKNQGKTTIKINIQVGREIIGRIDMPTHKSVQKELERGRLLFYVAFEGGRGYLDSEIFNSKIINHV